METPIKIETDGQYKIKMLAVDKAGNRQEIPKIIEVHKDTIKPEVGTPIIESSKITATGFEITIAAGDETSKVSRYEYYINQTKVDTKTTGTCEVTGLIANTEYNVYVRVYDNAGNYKDSLTTHVITKGVLGTPKVEISGPMTNGYYTGTVTVKIIDTAEGESSATGIRYTINGSNYTDYIGTNYTFTITEDRKL